MNIGIAARPDTDEATLAKLNDAICRLVVGDESEAGRQLFVEARPMVVEQNLYEPFFVVIVAS